MLNWGDKDSAEGLAAQLRDLLKDRTMTFDQLASVYSIKHGSSVTQRLKEISRDGRPITLGNFITQMMDFFETVGASQVRAKRAPPPLASPPAGGGYGAGDDAPPAGTVMKYADVSRGIQNILKEQVGPILLETLEDIFLARFNTSVSDIVGMSTDEYLQRKDNIFDFRPGANTVALQSSLLSGPPISDPQLVKDEMFVVNEFAQLIESMGPVVYISTLCGKFIQRNGISVTSIISTRPLDLFKRHPSVFLIVGAGNVALKKYEHMPEVQRLLDKPSSKAQRIAKAAEEAQLPVPDVVAEAHVVEEFRRLILADGTDSVYISSLCGRFLQRFKKPVTAIINCKPAEFMRRYPDIFIMTGGGNVGLREVLGPDAVSVPPPPPRVPKALREDAMIAMEALQQIELTDQLYSSVHSRVAQGGNYQAVVQRLLAVCRQVEQASFLALQEVVLGGAVGKGLLTTGLQAEVVLFVKQLPYKNFAQWLPHILDTLAPVLEYQLSSQHAEKFKVEKDHLQFMLASGPDSVGECMVHVYISPAFKGRDHLLECVRSTPPADRFYFYPAMVKERNDLVGRQPQRTKMLIRLITWWSSKQTWSSPLAQPSDWLLELVVIHVCANKTDQPSAEAGDDEAAGLAVTVDEVMDVLAQFESVKVTWADSPEALYSQQDIWKPLLTHEPLFMDPLNPFSNLADVNSFDAREVTNLAQQPTRLDCFKREAAQLLRPASPHEDDDDYEDAEGGEYDE